MGKKWNSVFANLAISYVSIVLVIVLMLCSIFYIYFSSNYKEDLRSENQLILEHTVQTIEATVLQRVQQIYLDLSLDKTVDVRWMADSSLPSHPSRVIDLQELLTSKVTSNSDIVHAVHLYDPGQNMLLSSLYGLILQADQGSGSDFLANWVSQMRSSSYSSSHWTPTRTVPQDIFSGLSGDSGSGNALITYTHSYPFQVGGVNHDLVIAIDVKESAISSIIHNMMPSQYSSTFILDSFGSKVSDSDKNTLGERSNYGSSITQALMSETAFGSISDTIDRESYVISYRTLPSTGWKIYSYTPSISFYEKSIFVQKLILGICLLAILIGIVLSRIWARANYSPVKRLVGKIKDLSDPSLSHVTNEYRLIDTAFVKLNDKVNNLEETLQANSTVIRQNIVLNMLRNQYSSEELAEELPLLGVPREYKHSCCMLLNTSEALDRLNSWDMQAAVYGVISHLEAASMPDVHLLAEELPDKNIVIIVCAKHAGDAILDELSRYVLSEGRRQFNLDFQISWGSWVQDMLHAHRSYSEAQILMKYSYFLPELTILNDRRLLDRENSLDEIPQAVLARFREKLPSRQLQEIVMAVDQLVMEIREGMYPADYCHFVLSNTVFVYSDYLKSVRYKHPTQDHLDLYNQYIKITHISRFRDWLIDSLTTFIDQMDKRQSDRASTTIEAAKQYIDDHLSEDLSLNIVAEQVFISPKYLSKLFKEELGITYTEYVTNQRMAKAKALISNNKLTIEQIAISVGYGTAAYFIKKFKEMHGCTPRDYLRNTVNQV
ncbi:helix-turn-helix domain-containing protein [Paenibacillus turpanensis]|uniref:helix-turn-helix domain-containing protein n=1 Tax=Paenibacillus turpanensis TaxID=2689078 RepID=UPI001FB82098|nr:helix-turn-helix domain-containing protein [Paenibacillus turpanensis]